MLLKLHAAILLLFLSCSPGGQADPHQFHLPVDWPEGAVSAIGTMKFGVMAGSSARKSPKPIASIAKIITALAIMEKHPLRKGEQGDTFYIQQRDLVKLNFYRTEGCSILPVQAGMKITLYQAMQRMLIASDNLMADVLVRKVFGSEQLYLQFAQKMLMRMGLPQTHVADACGLNPETKSTPSELVLLGKASLRNKVIAGIVSQKQVKLKLAGKVTNTNQILGNDGVIGIKTGTPKHAGSCLLFAVEIPSRNDTIVGVIMGDEDHKTLYANAKNLMASTKNGLIKINSIPAQK